MIKLYKAVFIKGEEGEEAKAYLKEVHLIKGQEDKEAKTPLLDVPNDIKIDPTTISESRPHYILEVTPPDNVGDLNYLDGNSSITFFSLLRTNDNFSDFIEKLKEENKLVGYIGMENNKCLIKTKTGVITYDPNADMVIDEISDIDLEKKVNEKWFGNKTKNEDLMEEFEDVTQNPIRISS